MILLSILLPALCLAQESARPSLKGRMFLQWGYNRAWFSQSDIRFTGADHDFTLRAVTASDRPEPFSLSGYFSPSQIWIPQYNYRAGWFFHDRWSISIGLDHMKYVVNEGQEVRMDGYARPTGTGEHDALTGSQGVILSSDFLRYEHTDGLNLLSVDADHYDVLWRSANDHHSVRLFEGAFAGPVIPRTDVHLFGEGLNNKFHLAGFGLGAQTGLHAIFFRHFFVRTVVKGGYIDLPDVLTTGQDPDRASQHFWFLQWYGCVGGMITLSGGSRSATSASSP